MKKGFLMIICIASVFACKEPEARLYKTRKSGSFTNESIQRNKELIAQEEVVIKNIITKDTTNTYTASENGFWYTYITKDTLTTSKRPVKGDLVTFTYDIKTLQGTSILSKEEIGNQIVKIDQSNQDLISGIRDGLKLLKQGETATFLFPSHKAYGYYGLEDKIGSNIPIRSTVQILNIKEDNHPK